jgi:23S rRNA pseudouridine2604 synthase
LTQGLNRQIRRMCEYLTYEVETLKRVRIMNIPLDMAVGEYRELTNQEFKELNLLLEDSTKTYLAKSSKKKP